MENIGEKIIHIFLALAIVAIASFAFVRFFFYREDGTCIFNNLPSESRTNKTENVKTEANVRVLWSEKGVWCLRIEGHNYLATGLELANYKTLVHAASCPCGHANANTATK